MFDRCLILRFSSIGDIVLTTSVIEYLAHIYPTSELHFLTLTQYQALLEKNPLLTRVIGVEKNSSLTTLRCFAETINNYDLYMDLHNSLRTRYLRRFLKSKEWLVYRKPRLNRLMLFNLHLDWFPPDYDVTSEYIRLLSGQALPENIPTPRIYISEHEHQRAQALLLKKGVDGDYAVMIPGAAWKTKSWLNTGYAEVANLILREDNLSVVLLGGSNDSICDTIFHITPFVVNMKGKTDLRTSLAILSSARVVIGGDTGLVHAAEAVGTPVVMINGPTSWHTGARVLNSRSVELTSQVWCHPCSKNGSRPCYRREQFCMTNISPVSVLSSVRKILAEA